MYILVVFCRPSGGLFRELLDDPGVLQLRKDILDHRELHDGVKSILALASELAHASLQNRIRWNELRSVECGVDVFVDDRGLANRSAVLYQCRDHASRGAGGVFRLHLIKPDQNHLTAAALQPPLYHAPSARQPTTTT